MCSHDPFFGTNKNRILKNGSCEQALKSVPWTLAEFYFNRGLHRSHTGTCTILQKTINGFLCLLIVSLKKYFN